MLHNKDTKSTHMKAEIMNRFVNRHKICLLLHFYVLCELWKYWNLRSWKRRRKLLRIKNQMYDREKRKSHEFYDKAIIILIYESYRNQLKEIDTPKTRMNPSSINFNLLSFPFFRWYTNGKFKNSQKTSMKHFLFNIVIFIVSWNWQLHNNAIIEYQNNFSQYFLGWKFLSKSLWLNLKSVHESNQNET